MEAVLKRQYEASGFPRHSRSYHLIEMNRPVRSLLRIIGMNRIFLYIDPIQQAAPLIPARPFP
ncbi:hypothetical protein D3C73_1598580 [compost metagenome]